MGQVGQHESRAVWEQLGRVGCRLVGRKGRSEVTPQRAGREGQRELTRAQLVEEAQVAVQIALEKKQVAQVVQRG